MRHIVRLMLMVGSVMRRRRVGMVNVHAMRRRQRQRSVGVTGSLNYTMCSMGLMGSMLLMGSMRLMRLMRLMGSMVNHVKFMVVRHIRVRHVRWLTNERMGLDNRHGMSSWYKYRPSGLNRDAGRILLTMVFSLLLGKGLLFLPCTATLLTKSSSHTFPHQALARRSGYASLELRGHCLQ